MKIQVDNREKNSRLSSCVKFFTDEVYAPKISEYTGACNGQSTSLTISQLDVGDYIFNNNVCFEYKTAIDMISSIIDGRVFKQANRMKEYPYSYIIIVGDVSKEIEIYNQNRYYRFTNKKKPSFTIKSYLGAIARLSIMSKVIHVSNMHQAWQLMYSIALKVDSDKEHVIKPLKLENPIASFLTCVPINNRQCLARNKALNIVKELNLSSLDDLLNVTYEDLVSVKGIGSKTAYKILEVI